jgi:hypothetical protein
VEKSSIFEKTIQAYLDQLQGYDFRLLGDRLGIRAEQEVVEIPLLGVPYRVSAKGIFGPDGRAPHAAVGVIVCKYILLCPGFPPVEDDWFSFKDFRDAAPLVGAFSSTVEAVIAREFSGRAAALGAAAERLGGRPPPERYPYDLSAVVPALPKVPLLLLFSDADGEFPAACRVLFERRAERYLDMECLAMTGMLFADLLVRLRQEAAGDDTSRTTAGFDR